MAAVAAAFKLTVTIAKNLQANVYRYQHEKKIVIEKLRLTFCSSALLIAVLVVLGVFFRFANLDKKIYWPDEIGTSFRIAGYTAKELKQEFFAEHDITVQDIQKYQRVRSDRGVLDVIGYLALEEPQHPPLYFVLARLWAELFGDFTGAIRSLSAFLSLLAIPGLYWLCRELFDSPSIASLATMLIAVSPFHVLYAQEARPYSLWILMTILSSAALLRAMRLKTVRSWALYALTLVGGMYSHLFFGLVVLGHGIYVVTPNGVAFKRSSPYLVSSAVAFMFFLPWVLAIIFGISQAQKTTEWIRAAEVGPLDTLKRWTFVFSNVFMDTGTSDILKMTYGIDSLWIHLIRLPVLLLIGYSLYFLYREASSRITLFVFALAGSSLVPLIFPDLILGWQLSNHPRFLIPYYLSALLSVAYLLTAKCLLQKPDRRAWQAITVIVVCGGVVSCALSFHAETWWNKGGTTPQLARIINQAARPLLISAFDTGSLVNVSSLSSLLAQRVRIRVVTDSNELQIPDDGTDVFLIDPPESLRQRFAGSGYRLEPAYATQLWRLTKTP